MRIHSDTLTPRNVHEACASRGMQNVYADVTVKGSRSRAAALEVKLTGNSPYRPNGSCHSEDHAAQWDEWGMVIAELYRIDPEAIIGRYPSKGAFDEFTGYRFESLTAPFAHRRHKWNFVAARYFECDCGASMDHNAPSIRG